MQTWKESDTHTKPLGEPASYCLQNYQEAAQLPYGHGRKEKKKLKTDICSHSK